MGLKKAYKETVKENLQLREENTRMREELKPFAETEREACALLCDKSAAAYRSMKDGDAATDAECEELAYCCELNARFIRERS